jgi:hypothetical protein
MVRNNTKLKLETDKLILLSVRIMVKTDIKLKDLKVNFNI